MITLTGCFTSPFFIPQSQVDMAPKPLSYYLSITTEPAASVLQSLEAKYGSYFQGLSLEEKQLLLAITAFSLEDRLVSVDYQKDKATLQMLERLVPVIESIKIIISSGCGFNFLEFLLNQIQGY